MEDILDRALGVFLPPEMMDLAQRMFVFRTCPQGTVLLRAGTFCQEVYLIVKGSVKMSYYKEGKEHIGDFQLEGEFVTDYASFLTGQPSRLFITCLEDTELLVLSRDKLQGATTAYPLPFERMLRLVAEKNLVEFARRIWSSLIDSPEERYRLLLEEKPHWNQRFPQYMIASYLGLTPEGLSKIRRRMKEEG